MKTQGCLTPKPALVLCALFQVGYTPVEGTGQSSVQLACREQKSQKHTTGARGAECAGE